MLYLETSPCSLGLSATRQHYFSLRTNQPLVLFSQNKPAPAASQTNRLLDEEGHKCCSTL
jgi:hypothetical protein